MSGEDPDPEQTEDGDPDPFAGMEDPVEDPFADIEADERETDPFEELAADRADRSPADERATRAAADAGAEPTAPIDEDRSGTQGHGDSEDPFAGLGPDARTGDPFEGFDPGEAQARPDDDLWEDLSREEGTPETERRGQRRFAEVSKHRYCERCEYFSDPPDVACSQEGTDIIEFVDSETVRLADCPIVAEREALADLDTDQ